MLHNVKGAIGAGCVLFARVALAVVLVAGIAPSGFAEAQDAPSDVAAEAMLPDSGVSEREADDAECPDEAHFDDLADQEVAATNDERGMEQLALRFDAAGAQGEMPDAKVNLAPGLWHEWTLPACAFENAGCRFAGWAIIASLDEDVVVPDECVFNGPLCTIQREGADTVDLDLRDFAAEGAVTLKAVWAQGQLTEGSSGKGVSQSSSDRDDSSREPGDPKQPVAPAQDDEIAANTEDDLQSGDTSAPATGVLVLSSDAPSPAGGAQVRADVVSAPVADEAASDADAAPSVDVATLNAGASNDEDVAIEALVLQPDEGKALVLPAGSIAFSQTTQLMAAAGFSHASVYMTAVSNGGGSKSATAGTSWASVNTTSGDWHLYDFTFKISGGGTTGGIQYQFRYLNNGSFTWSGTVSNGGHAVSWSTPSVAFKIWLTGNYASAYTIDYNVHGYDQSNNVPHSQNGAESSDGNAAIDGLGLKLIPKSYNHYVSVRYEKADGTWGSYSTARTSSVAYGSTVPAWSRAQDSTYKAASLSSYTAGFANTTKQVSVYRRTATNTIQARYQNADGTWGSYSNVSSGTDRVGAIRSWSRAQDATYQAASASITGTASNQTKQVSVYRRTATNTIQARYQNADGTWGSYSNVSSGSNYVGQVRSWSRAADATYQAVSASITGTASNQTKQVSVGRNSYTTSFDTQGGSAQSSITRLAGAKFAPPGEPTRDGYVFEGWWTAPDGGTRVTADTDTPSSDITYYAHWTPVVNMPIAGFVEDGCAINTLPLVLIAVALVLRRLTNVFSRNATHPDRDRNAA